MARMDMLRRHLRMLNLLLRAQGATYEELAASSNSCKRTARRLMLLLQEEGFPIYDEIVPGTCHTKRWHMLPDQRAKRIATVRTEYSEVTE